MISVFIRLFKTFSRKEFLAFSAASFLFLISFSLAAIEFIGQKTEIVPVMGGEYVEGLVGQPSFINPVLASGDVDRAFVELAFSGLAQMAEAYKADEKGKIWRYRLKENVYWQDGEKITSDDVIFTVETIQNPDVYSPNFQNWQGVNIQRISEREVEFQLPASYVFFKTTLEDLKPIPKHIFAQIPAANLRLSEYNLQPVGSGPFKATAFEKRKDGFIDYYNFEQNENYFGDAAYLKKIKIVFYGSEENLADDFNAGKIDGFGTANSEILRKIFFPYKDLSFKMLKYYALFLNSYSHPALKEKNVRMALDSAIDKKEIIGKIFGNYADVVSGPLVEGAEGFDFSSAKREDFSIDKAVKILENNGWSLNEENVRQKKIDKETVKLEFVLTIPQIQPLVDLAELIRRQWEKIGVKAEISTMSLSEINSKTIKTRDYQALMFGNILGKNSDIYSFWHSSEKFYPGLNLALYENKSADKLMESIRENFNKDKRLDALADLQSLIVSDYPAIFLYSPRYVYVSKKNFFGFNGLEADEFISFSSDRFKNSEKWYVKTARVFK